MWSRSNFPFKLKAKPERRSLILPIILAILLVLTFAYFFSLSPSNLSFTSTKHAATVLLPEKFRKKPVEIVYITFPGSPVYRCVNDVIIQTTLLHNPSLSILSPPSCFSQYQSIADKYPNKKVYYYDVNTYFDEEVKSIYQIHQWAEDVGEDLHRAKFETDNVARYYVLKNWMKVHDVPAMFMTDHDVITLFDVESYWRDVIKGRNVDLWLVNGLGMTSFWGERSLYEFCEFVKREMRNDTRTGIPLNGVHDMMATHSFVHLVQGMDARPNQRGDHQKGKASGIKVYETIGEFDYKKRALNWVNRNKDLIIRTKVYPLPAYDDVRGHVFDHNVHSLSHFSNRSFVGIGGERGLTWLKNEKRNVQGFKQIVICDGLPYFVYDYPHPRLVRALTIHFQGSRKRMFMPEFGSAMVDELYSVGSRCICKDVACSGCKVEEDWLEEMESEPLRAQMSLCGNHGIGLL